MLPQTGLSSSAPSNCPLVPRIIFTDFHSLPYPMPSSNKYDRNVNSNYLNGMILSNSFPSEHSLSRLSDTYCLQQSNIFQQTNNTRKDNNVLKIDFPFVMPSFTISSKTKSKENN